MNSERGNGEKNYFITTVPLNKTNKKKQTFNYFAVAQSYNEICLSFSCQKPLGIHCFEHKKFLLLENTSLLPPKDSAYHNLGLLKVIHNLNNDKLVEFP